MPAASTIVGGCYVHGTHVCGPIQRVTDNVAALCGALRRFVLHQARKGRHARWNFLIPASKKRCSTRRSSLTGRQFEHYSCAAQTGVVVDPHTSLMALDD